MQLSAKDVSKLRFEPADFEKDQDLNFHIDFVAAASNMRSWNYRQDKRRQEREGEITVGPVTKERGSISPHTVRIVCCSFMSWRKTLV